MNRKTITLFFVLVIGMGLGVSTPSVSASQPTGPLTIGYTPYMPFMFDGKDGQPRGILKDLWDLWSAKNNIPVSFVRLTRDDDAKKTDVIAVVGSNTKAISTIDLPLSKLDFFLFVRSDRSPPLGKLQDLYNQSLGVVAGGPANEFLNDNHSELAITSYKDHESLIQAAMANEVQAFVMEKPVASTYLAKLKGNDFVHALEAPLFSHPLQAGVSADNPVLIKKIEAGFSRISQKEIKDLLSNWTGESSGLVWRPHTKTLKIAASIDNMPFHFADEKGKAVGMFVDLWNLWSDKTGVPIEFIPVPWAQSLSMVRTGQADIHAGCFFSVQRDTFLDYADELRDCQTHFFFHESIYGLKGLQDLKGFEIGVLDQDYAVEFVHREMPGAALKIYESHQALFKGVQKGEIKVFICDTPTALYFLTKKQLISRYRYHPSKPLYRKPFFAAVREGNQSLIRLINEGLAVISPEERAAIERRWMGTAPELTRNQVIIGVDQSFAPFSMRSANGEPSGLLVDYWQAWARKTGQNAVIRLYERQEAVNALKDGVIDILSTFPSRKTTQGWVGFSAPYYRLDWYLYQPLSRYGQDIFEIHPDTDFIDLTIGTLENSRIQEWLDEKMYGPMVIEFDTTEQMIIAAGQSRIDGFLATPQEMAVLPGQMGVPGSFSRSRIPVLKMTARAGVRNFNPGLVEAIESGYNRMSQVEKARIEARWISEPKLRVYSPGNKSIQLSDDEEKWLTELKLAGTPIRLGVEPAWPPFEFMGDTQEYLGMVSDIVGILKSRLGISIDLVSDPLASGVDVIPAAFSFEAHRSAMAYTRPYLSFPWVIITRTQAPLITGLLDMKDKILACDNNYESFRRLKQDWPRVRLMGVESTHEGLKTVLSGKADGYLGNLALAGYQIQAHNYNTLKVAAATAIDNGGLVFAVRKDWPELVSILNKGIESLTSDELDQVRQKWFTVRFEQSAEMAVIRKMALRISIGVLLVFILVLFWNRMIRRREERFRCLTEHGTDIIQAFTREGRLVYVSPSHSTVLGYRIKKIKNQSVFNYIHPNDVREFRLMLDKLIQTGGTATHVYRIRHFLGHDLFFESHCMNLLHNRAIKAFVLNSRDITDPLKARKEIEQAKESAEAANQSKTDFLAGLSHEVRTPLNAILGMTEMTLNTDLTNRQNKNLTAVFSAARHLKAVISDILDFSTIEAGKMKIRQREFRLDRFLENLDYTWRFEAEKKGLQFDFKVSDKIPGLVKSDPVRLGQILTNLLSNAVKFTLKGKISFRTGLLDLPEKGRSGSSMMLFFEIKDTGIGIASDHTEKIFQRFTQAQGSITREYGGTGLGLAICKEMAQLMGGTIEVKSEPGRGSCFTLKLPFVSLGDEVENQGPGSTGEPAIAPDLTLLLAEDDPVNQAVFREMLDAFGCRVLHAGDGEQALALLKENDIDMVFMDIEMPRMDGLTASSHIRQGLAGERNRAIPIIAMTAHVLKEFRSKTKSVGMDEFIPKPIERRDLIEIITRYQPDSKPSTKDPLVDRAKALASLGGNEQLLETVYGIFTAETPALISNLESALESGDFKAIGLAAHTLKGAGGRVYSERAVLVAARLESTAKSDDPDMTIAHQAGQETLRVFENVIECLKKKPHP